MPELVLALVIGQSGFAAGQPTPPRAPGALAGPPGFSPYLNLLRPGSSPAVNYFGLVRPEQQLRQQLGQLQQQFGQFAAPPAGANPTPDNLAPPGDQFTGPTGHTFTFNNTGGYFNRLSGMGGAGSIGRVPGGANPAGAKPAGGIQAPKAAGGRGR